MEFVESLIYNPDKMEDTILSQLATLVEMIPDPCFITIQTQSQCYICGNEKFRTEKTKEKQSMAFCSISELTHLINIQ